jgi:hypothetical protein
MRPDDKFGVGLIIYKGKVYLQTKARTDQGATIIVDPVYIAKASLSEIKPILIIMMKDGNPRIPHPEDFSKIKQVTLIATRVKSWKQLIQNAAAYSIIWRANDIVLEMSRPNSKLEWDISRERIFPPDTDLDMIIQAILDDVHSRPEVQSSP